MNSEVGTGSADFTYIKNALCFEVDTWNADFETAKVSIRSADFLFFCMTSFGSRQVDCRLPHSESW